MQSITGTYDISYPLFSLLDQKSLESSALVSKEWKTLTHSSDFQNYYVRYSSPEYVKNLSFLIFKKQINNLSINQLYNMNKEKINRILLDEVVEDDKNIKSLKTMKFIASLFSLKKFFLENGKKQFKHLLRIDEIIEENSKAEVEDANNQLNMLGSIISLEDVIVQDIIREREQKLRTAIPKQFAKDWMDLKNTDLEVLETILEMEFSQFTLKKPYYLSLNLFKAFCRSLETKDEASKPLSIVLGISNGEQLVFFGEILKKSLRARRNTFELLIQKKVTEAEFNIFKQAVESNPPTKIIITLAHTNPICKIAQEFSVLNKKFVELKYFSTRGELH